MSKIVVAGSFRLLLVLAIAAFGTASLPSAESRADTRVRYVEVVRNLAYMPSYVAMAKGSFMEVGIDISLSTAQGGDKAPAMILSCNADITLVGPETAIYVWNSESPDKMKIFCSLTATSTNFFVSRKKMTPAEFQWSLIKGKNVLGWRPGSTPSQARCQCGSEGSTLTARSLSATRAWKRSTASLPQTAATSLHPAAMRSSAEIEGCAGESQTATPAMGGGVTHTSP